MYSINLNRLLLIAWLVLQGCRLAGLQVSKSFQPSNVQLSSLSAFNFQQATRATCPSDVQTLTALLIRDLPSYANRVIQRARRLDRSVDSFSYVIVAGRPEFEPLTLGPGQYSDSASATNVEPPDQVFLTTLERQYQRDRAVESEHYHWLFLTQTSEGWRLALMFSRIDFLSGDRPPTPPRESSNGVIGQAVKIWLRDCHAGAIRPS